MNKLLKILNLRFEDKTEKEFSDYYLQTSLSQIRLAFISVIIIYSSFGLIDKLVATGYFQEFLFVRFAIVIPFFLVSLILTYTKFFKNISEYLLSLNVLLAGLSIIYFLYKHPQNFTYYNAVIIVLAAGYFMVRMKFLYSAITGFMILAVFNIVFINSGKLHVYELISLNLLYLTANFMGIFASYFFERYTRIKYLQEKEISDKKTEIEDQNLIYYSTFNQAQIALIHLSEDLVFLRSNYFFDNFFGNPEKNNISDWNEFQNFYQFETDDKAFFRLKNSLITYFEDTIQISLNKKDKFFKIYINKVSDNKKESCFFSIFFHDITQNKINELELKKQLKRIEMTNKTMIDREFRIIELKKEINKICKENNLPEKFDKIW